MGAFHSNSIKIEESQLNIEIEIDQLSFDSSDEFNTGTRSKHRIEIKPWKDTTHLKM